ncbi:hypothetical protein [Kutzneria buriramensis]|uniref:Uncharacterized protein n=1 Tax=Kutzneria buriramensis TaxID=1045776 RepID=A0A3E0HDV0_9PSEU|nr:hypothetical protein [Kutzneria buriramensis]REH42919.1 hypothetical protein BCF44_110424 [Kutzneria buriramensis]
MNEVDRLREAMAQPPGEQFAEVDVQQIMRRGGRLRLRRRLLTAAGAVAVLAAVAGSVIGVQLYRDGQASSPVSVAAPPVATNDAVPATPVLDTQVVDPTGNAVLYFSHGRNAAGVATYRLVLAHKDAAGKLTPVLATDADLTGGGFHNITTGHPGSFLPLFGYFVGPVAQIKAMYRDQPAQVMWKQVPELNVAVFWLPPKNGLEDVDANSSVQLDAFDAQGNGLYEDNGPTR